MAAALLQFAKRYAAKLPVEVDVVIPAKAPRGAEALMDTEATHQVCVCTLQHCFMFMGHTVRQQAGMHEDGRQPSKSAFVPELTAIPGHSKLPQLLDASHLVWLICEAISCHERAPLRLSGLQLAAMSWAQDMMAFVCVCAAGAVPLAVAVVPLQAGELSRARAGRAPVRHGGHHDGGCSAGQLTHTRR